MDLKEFKNAMKRWGTDVRRVKAIKPPTVDDAILERASEYKFSKAFPAFLDRVTKETDGREAIGKLVNSVPEELRTEFARRYVKMFRSLMNFRFHVEKIPFDVKEVDTLDAAECVEIALRCRDMVEDKREFDFQARGIFANELKNQTNLFENEEALDRFLAGLSDQFGELSDEAVPDDREFLPPTELGDANDEHPHAEEIRALAEEYRDDAQTLSALREADRILIHGEADAVHYTGDLAEEIGRCSDTEMVSTYMDTLRSHTELDGKWFEPTRRHIEISSAVTLEDRERMVGLLEEKNRVLFTEEEKEQLKEIVREMKESGIYESDRFGHELQVKSYSLTALLTAQNNVEKALKEKDTSALKEATEKYAKIERSVDSLIAKCMKLNPESTMVSNISSSRVSNVPAKYRNDIVGVSRLSGVWLMMGLCDKGGISPEEFIDDPMAGLRKITEHAVVDRNEVKKYARETDAAKILSDMTKSSGDYTLAHTNADEIASGLDRGVLGLMAMIPSESGGREKSALMAVYTSAFATDSIAKQATASNLLANSAHRVGNIARLLFCEPEDRDPAAMNADGIGALDPLTGKPFEKFEKERYFATGKTTALAVIMRGIRTGKELSEKYRDFPYPKAVKAAVSVNARDLLAMNAPMSETVRAVAETLAAKKPIKATDLRNIEAEDKFFRSTKDGIRAENVADAVSQIAGMKQDYDRRSFFAKVFYSSVRRQSRAITAMKKTLTDAGLAGKTLDEALRHAAAGNEAGYGEAVSHLHTQLERYEGETVADGFVVVERIEVPEAAENVLTSELASASLAPEAAENGLSRDPDKNPEAENK